MTTEYSPEDLLPLSGIQHFLFCRRQWALIHVERQWQENALTSEGKILHNRVDDPFFTEKRKGMIIARSVPVASTTLGLFGICDVVEFTHSPHGVSLPGYAGIYLPAPVEYKRGKPKADESDAAQLCAQAINLTDARRDLVRKAAHEMHAYVQRGYTPKVKPFKGCKACSLADLCLPTLQSKVIPATTYIQQQIEQHQSESE